MGTWKPRTPGLIILLVFTSGLFTALYNLSDDLKQFLTDNNILEQVLPKSKYKSFANMTMAERRQFVKDRCFELNKREKTPTGGKLKAYVLMDNNHRLLGCDTPKVGSSTIVHLLCELNKLQKTITRPIFRNHVLLHALPPEIINLFPYPLYMFVRDPIERLFSAYKDHRGLLNINGTLMSFEHFLTDIANRENYTIKNIHYSSYYERCRPCEVDYQYFGTMETYSADLNFILQKANINISAIPRKNARPNKKLNVAEVKNLPLKIKRALWERYQNDYYIFGFSKQYDI